jgi:hypothetical protein
MRWASDEVDPEFVQRLHRPRRETVAADLVAARLTLFEHDDRSTGAGRGDRSRRSCRPAADHQDVTSLHTLTLTAEVSATPT